MTSPLGEKRNWVTETDPIEGLGKYVRAVAHALERDGRSESEAIRLAIGVMKRWARGEGNVHPSVRAHAAAAVAHWEVLKAKRHAHLANSVISSPIEGFPGVRVTQTIDLAAKGGAAKFVARTMPPKAHVRAAVKRASAWPDDKPQKKAALAMARLRGKQLGMDPKEYTPPTGAGKGHLFAKLAEVFNFGKAAAANSGAAGADLNTAARKGLAAKGQAMAGGRYPIRNAEDLHNAIRAVGRGKGSHALIRRYIKARAAALGLSAQIPDDWKAAA